MKMFLLLAVGSVVTAGVLPSLPAKIILSAFVFLAAPVCSSYISGEVLPILGGETVGSG